MPTYKTPAPIDLAVDLQVGALDVIAGDRKDTVVTVSPTNPDRAADVRAAEQAKVEFDGQRVTVLGMKRFAIIGPNESVDVRVELPAGSRVTVDTAMGGVRTTGRLAATRIKSSMGAVEIAETADLWVKAGHGPLTVGNVDGTLEGYAAHGTVNVGTVSGDARLKASHGNITVGEAGGDLDANLAYGDLEVARALASVTAKSAYGSVEVGEVSSGSIRLETSYGNVRVGIKPGVAAWLDLSSKLGRVRNELDPDRAPEPTEQAVEVRVRSQGSDITIHHAKGSNS